MATTYTLIEAQTLASTTASITLGSGGTIPQTYTDLVFMASAKSDMSGLATGGLVSFNGSNASFSTLYFYGPGSGTPVRATGSNEFGSMPGATSTAGIFSNNQVYIPNYTLTRNKSYSVEAVTERNATEIYAYMFAGRRDNTGAITSITYAPATGSFIAGSTFYLYGVLNS